MTKLLEKPVSDPATDSNPFASMGLIKFWLIATLFYLTFPISLGICFVLLGPRRTRQLIRSLVHDFLQTILLLLLVVVLLAWGFWHLVSPFFVG
tara:strand:+ start:234 stop:515 length:282 start_codon:yes stop_codon:yes gene_type:complete